MRRRRSDSPAIPGVGDPMTRVDGAAKVRGRARYAADHPVEPRPYSAWIVGSAIARGRLTSLDVSRARACDGVVLVLTHENVPPQRGYGEPDGADRYTMSHALLQGDRVHHHGDPIALIVADTLEAARGAALEVRAEYQPEPAACGLHELDAGELLVPDDIDGGQDADVIRGDFGAALEASEVVVDAVYTTPGQVSAAMEPHATIAEWHDGTLTVHTSIQILGSAVSALARTFELDETQVRIVAPFIGGGFGSKLGIHHDAVLASMAAMRLGHPVKLVQTRRQVFENAPHRSNSRQHLRLGARRDGTLIAVGHDSVMPMAAGYPFAEPCAAGARASYRCDALHTTHRVRPVNMPPVDSMRAPGEAIGSLALEGALDELAVELDMDPLELRLKNLAEREPQSGRALIQNDLGRCLERGAEKFGWSRRPPPRQRDGRWWIGWGLASCTRMSSMAPARARVRLTPGGRAIAELDMTDIGTGTYTILTQIVTEELGLEAAAVEVRLGDSALPETSGSGGSTGAASSGAAILSACRRLRETITRVASEHPSSPLRGVPSADAVLDGGRLWLGDHSIPLADLVTVCGGDDQTLRAEGSAEPAPTRDEYAQYSYGAHFVEAAVDDASGEVRLRRLLGAFSFGRVLNSTTARSQLIGAMTFGIGSALTEALMLDPRYGAFMNRDFAEYHLPVQRDVPAIEVMMLGEPDRRCGPLGSKGLGELAISGLGGAIASAVFHATGVRVRDFPITPDKILAGL